MPRQESSGPFIDRHLFDVRGRKRLRQFVHDVVLGTYRVARFAGQTHQGFYLPMDGIQGPVNGLILRINVL